MWRNNYGHCWRQIHPSDNSRHGIYYFLHISVRLPLTLIHQCPGCPEGGLDLSEGLFKFFASTDVGVLQGSWTFGGESGDSSNSTISSSEMSTSSTTGDQTTTSDDNTGTETSTAVDGGNGDPATTTSNYESTTTAHSHHHGHHHG